MTCPMESGADVRGDPAIHGLVKPASNAPPHLMAQWKRHDAAEHGLPQLQQSPLPKKGPFHETQSSRHDRFFPADRSGAASGAESADHQQHHPAGDSSAAPSQPSATPPTAPAQPPAVTVPPPSVPAQPPAAGQPQAQIPIGEMMQGMPEQCRGMMQNMPEGCRGMMQQMMPGGMMRQGMMPGQAASQSEATKAYMAAMERMNGPMMQGVQDSDADVAFVKSMIPHHQGAIEMAKVALLDHDGLLTSRSQSLQRCRALLERPHHP